MEIEKISVKQVPSALTVSLRGTMAEIASSLASNDERKIFVSALLKSENPNIHKFFEGDILVIGLSQERGGFFPDW